MPFELSKWTGATWIFAENIFLWRIRAITGYTHITFYSDVDAVQSGSYSTTGVSFTPA